ncbi:hypothetical protein NDN08_006914 [Rhodosorus marinus]|uniref:Uncharacterized protein n=1 Tax=Rhodosorus marinus TaxID=101924 RepID=A0AAV8UJ08_9RHOD|nr:hypothetical protein NDN08_006914 [Rhodosorus marinus]
MHRGWDGCLFVNVQCVRGVAGWSEGWRPSARSSCGPRRLKLSQVAYQPKPIEEAHGRNVVRRKMVGKDGSEEVENEKEIVSWGVPGGGIRTNADNDQIFEFVDGNGTTVARFTEV